MRTYKIYAAYSITANGIGSIQILRSGRIRSVRWAADINTILDNSQAVIELSFANTSQIGTSNTIGVVDELRMWANFVTSGLMLSAVHVQRILDMPVNAGEILYLNTVVATAAGAVSVFLDIEER